MTTAMAFISDARQTSASAIRHLCQLGGPRSSYIVLEIRV